MPCQHFLPASIKLTEWLWLIVGLPDTGIILVQRVPVLEVPLHEAPVEGLSVEDKIVDIGLLPLPELG